MGHKLINLNSEKFKDLLVKNFNQTISYSSSQNELFNFQNLDIKDSSGKDELTLIT